MMKTIHGQFEARSSPLPGDDLSQTLGALRMKFEKRFQGPLEATSLVAMTGILIDKTTGGYVAIEKVTGVLEGKRGSFCLQHSCTMSAGSQNQAIEVIPGTATEELHGLRGKMMIEIKDGQHFYDFTYEL